MIVKLINTKKITDDLLEVKRILTISDSIDAVNVANMYIELCEDIARGVQPDAVSKAIASFNLPHSPPH